VVLVGAEPWLLHVGNALSKAEVPVLVLSGDDDERRAAAAAGLLTHAGPLEADAVSESLEAVGARLALAGSRRQELNGLARELLADRVGRSNIYVLDGGGSPETNSRRAFGGRLGGDELARRVENGERVELWPPMQPPTVGRRRSCSTCRPLESRRSWITRPRRVRVVSSSFSSDDGDDRDNLEQAVEAADVAKAGGRD
jgi:hypothetical protein